MTTLEKVQAKIAKLQAQASAMAANQSSGAIAKIRDIMERHGLTTTDIEAHLGGKKRGRKPGVEAAAKSSTSAARYRDPKSGATWTGHGRAPAWIAKAKDRSKYLIEGNAVASAPAAKKTAAKAGAYVRGPQPAMYLNPKTGATWSGRGPAPAWLAGAKDRSKFLIAGAGERAAEPKATAAEKASAKKVATKTLATKKSVVAAKKVSAKKVAAKKTAAKKVVVKKAAARKAMSAKTSASRKAPAKKGTAKKAVPAASKKASTNKVSMTEAAVTAPMVTVESGAELTT
ncbi:Histone family protein nucleoid-structuring protein H-NS [Paraburkholderia piptadeniae]|uniref:Histone family protein nucleoid-structuring protein H-NS n=1 Tax=Paraburkholderia piptadeniae TaxID=1701573 RepID=A0A1N7SRK3_9BURK|nr:H-NS histone family protein [Paraburkholderia piptadeniae]SIT50052.1 Histone family protein nucleoid-structuring protein H-NS [Paraburkholderia piptadeniae]